MKSLAILSAVAGLLLTGVAYGQSGDDLLKSKGCLGCHDMQTKKVGPAYKDVAAKYKGKSGAEATIIGELKEGKGHPMKVTASDADLKTMVARVLSAK